MSTYLLDTSVIIDALNEKRDRHTLLLDMLTEGHSLACCPINITEVYAGMRPEEEEATERFLHSLHLIPLIWPVAKLAGEFKRDYRQKGQTLNLGDLIIAATAVHHNLPLMTDNTRDFPMKSLTLYPLPAAKK